MVVQGWWRTLCLEVCEKVLDGGGQGLYLLRLNLVGGNEGSNLPLEGRDVLLQRGEADCH